jgi:MHS family proline/betaine transporter-like MFS transporter
MGAGQTNRIIAAGAIGNVLEWYDFAIYGYFAAAIGRTFFPHESPVAQILAAFGIFAIGFLMRPIGGAIIGHIGDRLGRRAALTFSVAAMAVPTFLVGALPGYHVLGVAAPILLTLLRMIQGLSVGGEYTTSIVFIVEHAPPGRRGLFGAIVCSGTTLGILLGSASGAVLASMMSPAALEAWGWRIPFLAGLLVGLAGFLLRRHVQELKAGPVVRSPLLETLRDHRPVVARLAAFAVFLAVLFYISFVYIASWLQLADGIAPARALAINTLSMMVIIPVMCGASWLSDRIGRRPLLLLATAIGFVGAVPFFWLMHHHNWLVILLGQMGLVVAVGMYSGALAAAMVETTPPQVRCTAVAIGYNVTMGLLGGCSPLVATWLVDRTQDQLSPAYMIMAAALVSFVAALSYKETYRDKFAVA